MNIYERLQDVTRLFLDTAPVIYFVEENAVYLPLVEGIFDLLDAGPLTAVTSPITLAECLVAPYRMNQPDLVQAFTEPITGGTNTIFVQLDEGIGKKAAALRASYNLTLADAFQIAAVLNTSCDAFLTNDVNLKRVTELKIIVLDEMKAERNK